MNRGEDLKRMFDAQRKIDQGLAPSFDDLDTASHVSRDASLATSEDLTQTPRSLQVVVVVSVVAVSAIIGLFMWKIVPQPKRIQPTASRANSMAQTDLKKLNQVCDSLLVAIKESEINAPPTEAIRWEMVWPTGTDSLVPLDALTFNTRTTR